MQLSAEVIFEAAMALPENERLALAGRLMETLPPTILDDPDFVDELEQRFNDGSPTIPWSHIRDRK